MKKIFLTICAVALLMTGCGREEQIQTEKIPQSEEVSTIVHDGKIFLSHEVKVYADESGKVLEKYFKDGDDVTEGQKLFKVGNPDTQTELLQTKAALGEAMTNLAKETAMKNPVANLQAEIAALEERIEFLELETSGGIIYAPISGQLEITNAKLGETVQAAETVLATIGRNNPAVVRFEISQEDKKILVSGKSKVSLTFSDGSVYSRAGIINSIDDTAAEATFENPEGILLSGNTVQIELKNP